MSVYLQRQKDDTTKVRTNEKYLVSLLEKCKLATHIKTTRAGATFVLKKDLHDIPSNIYKFADFLKESEV